MGWQFQETLWIERGPAGRWDHTDDGAHVIGLEDVDGGHRVYWDGVSGSTFDELILPRDGELFSPDRNHTAVYGRRGKEFFVVVDGVESPAYADVTRSVPPTFSADGSRILYGALLDGRLALIVDGAPFGADHLAPQPALFSPDGRRVAYGAANRRASGPADPAESQWVVVDGVAGPAFRALFSEPGAILFSPDSRRVAYAARADDGSHLVLDGVVGPAHPELSTPTFSPDSRRVAYMVMLAAGKASVIVDGQQGPTFDQVGQIVFSPDSRRFAYFARRGKRWTTVVDHSPGPDFVEWYGLGAPTFSPDSRRVAYLGVEEGGGLLGRFKHRTVLMVDDARVVEVEEAGSDVHFSPDGGYVAFKGRSEGGWRVYVDGVPGPAFEEVGVPAWSPTGRLAYPARSRGRWSMTLDHQAGPPFDDVEVVDDVMFRFTTDGAHLAWAGRTGDQCRPVIDDAEGPWYGGVGRPIVGADGVDWLFLRAGSMWRVSAVWQ
jgi:dipeptidyl aminopeptidase/acylaminoacyl peptidase